MRDPGRRTGATIPAGAGKRAHRKAWITLLLAAGAAVGICVALMDTSQDDLAGARQAEVTGTVLRTAFLHGRTRWGPAMPQAVIRVGNQEVPVVVMATAHGLRPGRRMRFTVRIGRSGQWYVQTASPAPPDL